MKGYLCRISPCPGENFVPENGKELVQLLCGGVPAQGDPEGAVHGLFRHLHGGEHMAPVALGAGGTGGHADAVILQNVDGILGGNTGDGEGQNVGRIMGAVDDHTGQLGQFLHKAIQQFFFPGNISPEGLKACLAGGSKAEDDRCTLCAAAQTGFLTAAVDQGRKGFQPRRSNI